VRGVLPSGSRALLRRATRLARRSPSRTLWSGALVLVPVVSGCLAVSASWGRYVHVDAPERTTGTADVVYDGSLAGVESLPLLISALESELPPGATVAAELIHPGVVPGDDRPDDGVSEVVATAHAADWSDPLLDGVLRLVDGRVPGHGEVVLSPTVADRTGLDVGDELVVVGSERTYRVAGVGSVGRDEWAIATTADDLASMHGEPAPPSARLYVGLPTGAEAPLLNHSDDDLVRVGGPVDRAGAGSTVPLAPALGATAAVVVVVGLLAGAAFGIGAARRARATGLLSANGADGPQLAVAVVSEALVVALPAAVLGAVLALVLPLVVVGGRLPGWVTLVDVSAPPIGVAVLATAAVIAVDPAPPARPRARRRDAGLSARYAPGVRVLVTGATGFVGSHAVGALLDAGHDVRCLVRDPVRLDLALDPDVRERVDVATGDVLVAESVERALDGCDGVLHAAGAVGVAKANAGSRDVNVEGTRNVVGLAVDAGCDPIVYTSSIVVLDDTVPVMTADTPLGSPDGPYGRSKLVAEQYVRAQQRAGAPVTTFYIGGVFGPSCPDVASGMMGIVGAVNQVMPVTNGGVGTIDARDLAQLLTAAMEPGRGPRRYIAGGQFLSWAEWTDLLGEVIGRPLRRLPMPSVVVRSAGRFLDLLKVVRDFDYPLTQEAAAQMTSAPRSDDRATLEELGVTVRPVAETLADSVRWLIEEGYIDPAKAPRLAV
jgi:dihydroflavonol-4-reductase